MACFQFGKNCKSQRGHSAQRYTACWCGLGSVRRQDGITRVRAPEILTAGHDFSLYQVDRTPIDQNAIVACEF